jgi:hypothetical protein
VGLSEETNELLIDLWLILALAVFGVFLTLAVGFFFFAVVLNWLR